LRLGYLVPEFPSQTHVFFWREIQALRSQGVEVRLISTRRPAPASCRHAFAGAAAAETHYVFPPSPASLPSSLARLRRLGACWRYLSGLTRSGAAENLRHVGVLLAAFDLVHHAARERIDHVHVHSCADAAHAVALAHLLGGPSYSVTVHGDLHVYGGDHAAKLASATFVAAVGQHLVGQIVDEGAVPAARIHVTCMGVELAPLLSLGAERDFRSGALHVVTVARLNITKGHVHALAAVRRAVDAGADIRYTIAGAGEHRGAIEARVAELRLGERVRLVGTLSESEVFRLLGEADAFVLPSIGAGEAWPVSVMEAMAAGLPVISSVIGATPQMIESGVDGMLVEQADEPAFAEALLRLAGNVSARRAMGERARVTARERFDVRITAERLSAAVRATLSRGDGRRSVQSGPVLASRIG